MSQRLSTIHSSWTDRWTDGRTRDRQQW